MFLKAIATTTLFWVSSLSAAPLSIQISAEAAILMNADTGAVLFEKNAYELRHPASTTKIATALYALKKAGHKLDEIVTAQAEAVGAVTEEQVRRSNYTLPPHLIKVGSSHMGIKRGEQLTLRDLMYGMMLPSANDAANVIAQHIGGTIPNFMKELNVYLEQIGCTNTHFCSPHGLHHPDHVTTAYDMAVLTREALKSPIFCEIISTVRYKRPKTNKQESTVIVQTNRLLRNGPFYYSKAIGVKTGYGVPALHTFVAAARHEGRNLIAVVLQSKERDDIFRDSINMFEAAFNQPKVERELIKSGLQKYVLQLAGSHEPIKTYVEKGYTVSYYPAEEPKFKAWLTWDTVTLPLKKGQKVGLIEILNEKQDKIASVPLLTFQDVKLSKHTQVVDLVVSHKLGFGFIFAAMLLGLVIFIFIRKR